MTWNDLFFIPCLRCSFALIFEIRRVQNYIITEPVSKCFSLFKVKEGENFNHKTNGIHGVFRGLKFLPDEEIGQTGTF